MNDHSEWVQAIGEAISLVGCDDFYASLCGAFTRTPRISHPRLLYFPDGASPQVLYHAYSNKDDYDRQVGSYINGPYVLDPFYQACMNGHKDGAYRLNEVAPDNFRNTEYFRRYYRALKFRDEIAYIQTLPGEGHIQLSLGHVSEKGLFPIQTVRFLKNVGPIVNSLILAHWKRTSAEHSDMPKAELQQTLQEALQNFGSSLLTERERAVLQLILHGHSNKSTASKLDIALATVRQHRKNIYRKLDISSQAELFYLFIDSISGADRAADEDPLKAYMSVPT